MITRVRKRRAYRANGRLRRASAYGMTSHQSASPKKVADLSVQYTSKWWGNGKCQWAGLVPGNHSLTHTLTHSLTHTHTHTLSLSLDSGLHMLGQIAITPVWPKDPTRSYGFCNYSASPAFPHYESRFIHMYFAGCGCGRGIAGDV